MTYSPRPGDIGLSSSNSLIGRFVRFAQMAIGDDSFVTHAFIVLHDGNIIEAMPGGARFGKVSDYPDAIYSRFALTLDQRDLICDEAIRMYGTPYSFLDYLSLALTHMNFRPDRVRKYVQDSGHLICSQLVAEAYLRAGVELFPDRRLSLDVTPGDLARLLLEESGLTTEA